jgi:putative RNA 2'-phosphotransferase
MKSTNDLTSISKFLSLVLRHKPEQIGLKLDGAGWARIDELLRQAGAAGCVISRVDVEQVVSTSDKQRFRISDDGLSIRANQGHSIQVDLDLQPLNPPMVLYHGTAARFLESILRTGLQRRQRRHVHLSEDPAVALSVGKRHGSPVLLRIDAMTMATRGHRFYRSANGVWLVEHVDVNFIEVTS